MLPQVLSVYKPAGLTPLQALDRLREVDTRYATERLSYAGRLDPMAEGVMLVLVGDGNYEREQYLDLPKTYEAEILFGVATDTGDVLGLVTKGEVEEVVVSETRLREVLGLCVGTIEQEYPRFSSPKIAGKESFSKSVTIDAIDLLEVAMISQPFLRDAIARRIGQVDGDFRQAEILVRWDEYWQTAPSEFPCIRLRVTGSSGVYIRVLAETVGCALGVPALAYGIKRLSVGDYPIDTALKLE